jgi:hypothetical protein
MAAQPAPSGGGFFFIQGAHLQRLHSFRRHERERRGTIVLFHLGTILSIDTSQPLGGERERVPEPCPRAAALPPDWDSGRGVFCAFLLLLARGSGVEFL